MWKNKEDCNKYHREYYKRNRDKILQRQKDYEKSHKRDRIEYSRKYYKENKERVRATTRNCKLKRVYSISSADYNEILREQNNICAICGTDKPSTRKYKPLKYFAIDHDHMTGLIRGLLCANCNMNLAWYEQWKIQAKSYLKNN